MDSLQERKLPLKSWQTLFIKSDPSYGNLMASILQSIFKNRYLSLLNLIKSIDNNPSVLISGEGAIDLISKYLEPLHIIPKYYISNMSIGFDSNEDILETIFYESLITIRCDFLITFKPKKVNDLTETFIKKIEETIDTVKRNNRNILINYFLKLIKEDQYFIPLEFLEKSIYEERIPKTKYSIKDLFYKFNISDTDNIYDIIKDANKNHNNNDLVNNIKVLNVPFTPFHMNNYLKKAYQDVSRKKFGIGKSELNVKLLYLNPDYILPKTNKPVYAILAEKVFYECFYEGDKEGKALAVKKVSKDLDRDFDSLYSEVFKQKNSLSVDGEFDTTSITKEGSIKREIIKILKNDKVPTRELALINSVDIDRLMIKSSFVEILRNLSNPFLNKIIDVSKMNLLRVYLVTNYGDNLNGGISKEIYELIEKKLCEFVRSSNSYFIEYFSQIVSKIAEATGEKESVVENIILNSDIYQNFFFVRFLKGIKLKKGVEEELSVMKDLKKIGAQIVREGEEDNKVVVPYIKLKEFLIYLLSAEIDTAWEKLSVLFEEFIPFVKQSVFKAKKSGTEISVFQVGSDFNIIVKDKKEKREFQIKKLEEIEYIFQDFENSKLKDMLSDLYNLIQKRGFGFDNKKEFNELLQHYYKRSKEYYDLKGKSDRLYELTYAKNILFVILKSIIFWLPRALLELKLHKVSSKNDFFTRKSTYYYIDQKKEMGIYDDENEVYAIKERISNFIEFNKKVESSILTEKDKNKKNKVDEEKKLPELTEEEKELFDFVKSYLTKDKIVVFTHNPELQDEKILLYVKESGSKKFLEDKNNLSINTLDEFSCRYYLIKNLIMKRYLQQKEYLDFTLEKDKKTYTLHFSKYFV